MEKIVFSVIIPVYNIEKYLPECLESCMIQSVKEAEFICVNDGSTDSSSKIIDEYLQKDARFRSIAKENGGLSSARNAGMAQAKGEWLVFLDGDDRLKADALKRLSGEIKKGEAAGNIWDIIVFNADTFPVDIDKEPWFKKTLQFEEKSYDSFVPDELFKERGAMPFVWRHSYSRRVLDRTNVIFDEMLKYGEDVVFPMSIFPDAGKVLFSSECLYDYRLNRQGSLTSDMYTDADRVTAQHLDVIRHVAAFWDEKGWIQAYGADLLCWAMKYTILRVKSLKGDRRKLRAVEMKEIIYGYGLDSYKKELSLQGRLMWTAYSFFWRG